MEPSRNESGSNRTCTSRAFSRRRAVVVGATFGAGAVALVAALAAAPSTPAPVAQAAPATPAAKSSAAEVFKVDGVHSAVLFRIQHMGAGMFWGRFNAVEGTITFDGANQLAFDVSVDVGSIDTASSKRDDHLKSPDFFNAKEFPKMTFKSTSATKTTGNFYEVKGDLTMHGVTKPITAKVEWIGTTDMGARRAGFEATFTVNRADFGMNYGIDKGALGRDVQVIVALEAMPQK